MAQVDKSAKSLNILYISSEASNYKNDAQSMHTKNLAWAMRAYARKVVVVITGDGEIRKQENFTEIAVGRLDIKGNVLAKAFALFIKNIRLFRASMKFAKDSDIIYERQNPGCLAGIFLAWILRKPLYYEVNSLNAEEAMLVHGVNSRIATKLFHSIMQFQLNRAKRVFVQTEELKNILQANYRVTSVVVIPNGAIISKTSTHRRVRRKDDSLKCVYLGSIDGYHSLRDILETFKALGDRASLTVIGTGPMLGELRAAYSEVNSIVFLGSLPHTQALKKLDEADLGIAQYNLDSPLFKKFGFYFCPLKLLEYSSAGLPSVIIGTSNSFVKVFEDAGACVVVAESSQLQDKIVELANNSKEFTKMSANATRIVQEFSWEKTASRTVESFNA